MASSWASIKVLLQPIVIDFLILKEKESGFFSPYSQIYSSIDIPSWGRKKETDVCETKRRFLLLQDGRNQQIQTYLY